MSSNYNTLATARTPGNTSPNGCTGCTNAGTDEHITITNDLEYQGYENNSSHKEAEQPTRRQYFFPDEEPLCAGETKDYATTNHTVPGQGENTDDTANNFPEVQGLKNWAEKKRQFSRKQHLSEDSFSSEMSSQSRNSVSSYLYARECDAEQMLMKLGFSFDQSIDIPDRFWQSTHTNNPVLSRDTGMEEYETFDCTGSSLASLESSWSDSSVGRLPFRFASSLSYISPLSSVSEGNDNDNQWQSVIPSIIEPENTDEDDTFDLMRHLRLNRSQHIDKGFLEPVLEEQEVSSVGSGSARTKVDAQQDSFDSLGTVATKIFRKGESEDSTWRTQRSGSIPEVPENNDSFERLDSKENIIMERHEDVFDDNDKFSKDEQTMAKESLTLPRHKHLLNIGLPQDSFELEEIATSEENLDRIGETRSATETNRTNHLRRENSDESSGFEDDSAVLIKRRYSEDQSSSSDYLKEKASDSTVTGTGKRSPNKDQKTNLFVPGQFSTPTNDAETRQSASAKRHIWSTTKQKRVVFEDETYQRSWSFGDLPTGSRKLDVKGRSLDSCLPLSTGKTPSHADIESSLQKVGASPSDGDTQKRSSSENKAINNIKMFWTSLLSIRQKFKNPIRSKPDSLQCTSKQQQPTENPGGMVVCTSLAQVHVTRPSPSLLIHDAQLTSSQKSYHEEHHSFEENLQKYHTTFLAMEVISTSQDKYYTRKLQARFAWDILFIRRLRSQIKDELGAMQSQFSRKTTVHTTPLPLGVQHQMESLLKLQSGLREHLLTLATDSPDFSRTIQPSRTASFDTTNLMKDLEKKIRDSVIQELSSVFQLQINELRAEIKGKDTMINDLLKKVQQLEECK